MDIEDLRKFIHVARTENLQQSALALHVTAGALSKVIKRLEQQLNTPLFERVGRNIQLGRQGQKLLDYACHLVHEADQMISEFAPDWARQSVTISGPSVLMSSFAPMLTSWLPPSGYELNLDMAWEGAALSRLRTGQAHLALVTKMAFSASSNDIERISLGTTRLQVVAAKAHPLFQAYPDGQLTHEQLQAFCFACPTVSPFCGEARGKGSDGWPQERLNRAIGFRCNDFNMLLTLVQQGLAVAYMPEFVVDAQGLGSVTITDVELSGQEVIELAYRPSMAEGWLNRLVQRVKSNPAGLNLVGTNTT